MAAAAPIIAAAAPIVVGALTPRPGAPSFNAPAAPNMRPEYQRQILEGAFNPRSELYRQASERQAAQINRQLARRGLANSGMGIGAQSQAAADLGNRFLEGEQQRRESAYKTVTGADVNRYNQEYNAAKAQYDADAARYQSDINQRNTNISGIGSLVGAVGNYGAGAGWFSGGGQSGRYLPGTTVPTGGSQGDQDYYNKYGGGRY